MTAPWVLALEADVYALAERYGFPALNWLVDEGRNAWDEFSKTADPHLLKCARHRLQHGHFRNAAAMMRMVAQPSTPRAASPRPGEPTAAQWRAVRTALEKFCGLGAWSHLPKRTLPPFAIRWDDPILSSNANACCVFLDEAPGTAVLVFRTTQDPATLHRTALHELQHAEDIWLIDREPRWYLERRAEVTAAILSHVP